VGLDRRAVAVAGHVPGNGAVTGGSEGFDLGREGEVAAANAVQHQHGGAATQGGEGGYGRHGFGPYYMKFHAIHLPMTPSRQAQPPSFSPQEFRIALGMFATGVTIVTARSDDGRVIG